MIQSTNPPKRQNRILASNRWSLEEDTRLLELVQQKEDWGEIATVLKRTFSGVQNRFRFLKRTQAHAAAIVAKTSTKTQDPNSAPDLTCGSVSRSGRRVLEAVRTEISLLHGQAQKAAAPLNKTDLLIGALIREMLLLRYRNVTGWCRITVSRINNSEHGIGKTGLSRILDNLERCALLERTVGYPGVLALPHPDARRGRFVLLRASSRLINSCKQRRITASNVVTHFPSLAE
jgi:Myb-like DNA-binding domain